MTERLRDTQLSPRHRILDGLPPYGPPAEPFSATGQGLHSEGLVVEFTGEDGGAWVGNFQCGISGVDRVICSPSNAMLIVIAGGQAYVVDPATRGCVRTFGSQIEDVFELADRLVIGNGLWFEATDGERLLWRSRRVSWDGMRNVRMDGEVIVGEAYDPSRDGWSPFQVDIETGDVLGGTYPPELPQ